MTTQQETSTTAQAGDRGSRGRWLVTGMLMFGIAATALISIYWSVRLGPYAPYRRALRGAFPDGAPTVEGGNLATAPGVLRIVLKVGFTPVEDDARVTATADQVEQIAADLDSARRFDTLQLHLVHPRPERNPERLVIERSLH